MPRRLEGGIVCALVTPFRATGAIDLVALAELVEFQIERGVQGLFLLGTTGEGMLCSGLERKRLATYCNDRVRGRVPLVVHCGATDTRSAVDLVRHSATAGVRIVAATAPLFFPYPEQALYDHFARLVEAGPDLEHYLYDNPERVGSAIGVPLVCRLVDGFDQIVGVKDTGDSLARITEYLARDPAVPRVFTGNNLIILGSLVMGASGGVSALANSTPELFLALHEAYRDGQIEEARRLQLLVARLNGTLAGVPYIPGVKHLVSLRGLPGGYPRAPLPRLTSEQQRLIERRLRADPELTEWFERVV